MEILAQLTVVGTVTREDFEKRFDELFPAHANFHKILVIHDTSKDKIIGTGTVIFEKKFLRQCGTAGHIEDVSLDSEYRGKGLGVKLVGLLKEIATLNDCYKLILDCEDKNIGFYEKNEFFVKEKCMVRYRNKERM